MTEDPEIKREFDEHAADVYLDKVQDLMGGTQGAYMGTLYWAIAVYLRALVFEFRSWHEEIRGRVE